MVVDYSKAVLAIDSLANIKMNQYGSSKVIKNQNDVIAHLQLKCQYEVLDALNEILLMLKDGKIDLSALLSQLENGNYEADNIELKNQLERLGFSSNKESI